MHYNKIDPNDQKLHKIHHTSILHGPQFSRPITTTNNNDITRPLSTSCIPLRGNLLVISRSSAKETQKRALNLLSIIDTALGAPPSPRRTTFFHNNGKIYIILSFESGRVISLVAAERIDFAFRRIPNGLGIETTRIKEKALIGISRMWTCIAQRGKGLCSDLLEECAAGFVLGVDCTSSKLVQQENRAMRDFVAFSTPSESGMGLARKWTGRDDFLVYED
jgi:hypothetical protein